jgi:hypothetical protein
MNTKQFVYDLQLQEGQVWRGTCPACKRPKTFTAKNDMGTMLWNCYANSCNESGATHVNLRVEDIKRFLYKDQDAATDIPEFSLPPWVVVDNNQPQLINLCGRYELDETLLDLRYDVREDRVVFPIYQNGLIVDAAGRAMMGVQPKWRRYGVARTAFVTRTPGTKAVVVEDCISAAVVETLGGVGFALLGTTLLDEHKQMLRKYSKVIVALDPDARSKTLQYTRELKSAGIDAYALNLYDDIKYRNSPDVTAIQLQLGV